jgi:cobalt/nickel transport system permease protein
MNGTAVATQVYTLPLACLLLALAGLMLGGSLAVILAKRLSGRSLAPQTQRDWSIPALDSQAHRDSPFHRWEPGAKIVTLLFFMFCVASLSRPGPACTALALAVAAVPAARIPWRQPLRRLSALLGFLGMFLVVMPLTVPAHGGDTLLKFDDLHWLTINLRGLQLAGLICLKATAVALLADPLLATAPFPTTVQALARLRVPRIVCQMILQAHRYIFVFDHEASRMSRAMRMRGFRKRTDLDTLRTLGNFLGMLLVHSFERTQRVYEAMLSRGYDGSLPSAEMPAPSRLDWIKAALGATAGMALVLADHW